MAIPMVVGVLSTRLGLKRRGETCSNMTILPEMMRRFNVSMYDHKQTRQTEVQAEKEVEADGEEVDEEDMIKILNDVEQLLGEPVFLTE